MLYPSLEQFWSVVNTRLSPDEVSYIVDHSDAKFVVVDSEFSSLVQTDKLPKVTNYVTVCDVDDTVVLEGAEYEAFLLTGSPEPLAADIDSEDQLLSISYTSGTTGRLMGVMYHHRGAYLNAIGEVLESGLTASSVCLWTLHVSLQRLVFYLGSKPPYAPPMSVFVQ